MLNKLERKFGKYAVPNLINYLLGGYVIGYLLYYGYRLTGSNFLQFMTLEPYYIIHKFQIWRLITWVMLPPSYNLFWGVIMIIFYYQLGTILERNWGTFRFNVYIFGGILFTIIGAFILYVVYAVILYPGLPITGIGNYFSTSYINMTIFLAFATMYPDMEVRLYFLIPVKMKWMSILYAVLVLIDLVRADWGGRVAIIASVLNFVLFYLSSKDYHRLDPREMNRKRQFRQSYNAGARANTANPFGSAGKAKVARHKCAICGRTELTNPELTFRFCSKCNGNYEYCEEHIFTHKHIEF